MRVADVVVVRVGISVSRVTQGVEDVASWVRWAEGWFESFAELHPCAGVATGLVAALYTASGRG